MFCMVWWASGLALGARVEVECIATDEQLARMDDQQTIAELGNFRDHVTAEENHPSRLKLLQDLTKGDDLKRIESMRGLIQKKKPGFGRWRNAVELFIG